MRYCSDGTCREIRVGYFDPVFDPNGVLIATNFNGTLAWNREDELTSIFQEEIINGVVTNLSILDKVNQGCPLLGSYRRGLHTQSGFYVDEAEICSIIAIDGPSFPFPIPSDTDGDEVDDSIDNCPAVPNPSQENNENDSQGNACDDDDDNDGVFDETDNCPFIENTNQTDVNKNGVGDDCEPENGELCIPIKTEAGLALVCI